MRRCVFIGSCTLVSINMWFLLCLMFGDEQDEEYRLTAF